jgi:hypothetical protein
MCGSPSQTTLTPKCSTTTKRARIKGKQDTCTSNTVDKLTPKAHNRGQMKKCRKTAAQQTNDEASIFQTEKHRFTSTVRPRTAAQIQHRISLPQNLLYRHQRNHTRYLKKQSLGLQHHS